MTCPRCYSPYSLKGSSGLHVKCFILNLIPVALFFHPLLCQPVFVVFDYLLHRSTNPRDPCSMLQFVSIPFCQKMVFLLLVNLFQEPLDLPLYHLSIFSLESHKVKDQRNWFPNDSCSLFSVRISHAIST